MLILDKKTRVGVVETSSTPLRWVVSEHWKVVSRGGLQEQQKSQKGFRKAINQKAQRSFC